MTAPKFPTVLFERKNTLCPDSDPFKKFAICRTLEELQAKAGQFADPVQSCHPTVILKAKMLDFQTN